MIDCECIAKSELFIEVILDVVMCSDVALIQSLDL